MKRNLLYIFLLMFAVLSIFSESCKHHPIIPKLIDSNYHDTTKVIIPPPPVNPKDSICYSEEIQPLFTSYCSTAGCHDHTTRKDGIDMSSYDRVKASISGTKLWKYINHYKSKPMPPLSSPQMTQAQIDLIKKWIDEGMKKDIDCGKGCDTTDVKFSVQITQLLNNNCIGCHSNSNPSGGINLQGYTNVVAYVNAGNFMGSILHGSAFSPMPKGGAQLDICKIRQLQIWIGKGMPNN